MKPQLSNGLHPYCKWRVVHIATEPRNPLIPARRHKIWTKVTIDFNVRVNGIFKYWAKSVKTMNGYDNRNKYTGGSTVFHHIYFFLSTFFKFQRYGHLKMWFYFLVPEIRYQNGFMWHSYYHGKHCRDRIISQ
jgi:hypothetical protein